MTLLYNLFRILAYFCLFIFILRFDSIWNTNCFVPQELAIKISLILAFFYAIINEVLIRISEYAKRIIALLESRDSR